MKILRNSQLRVEIDEATLSAVVHDLRTGNEWRMQTAGPGDLGLRGHAGPYEGMAFASAQERVWEETGDGLRVTLCKWPYSANVWSPAAFGVVVDFSLRGDALRVELAPHRPLHGEVSLVDSYYPRGFLFPEGLGGKLVLPYGQGTLLDKGYPLELDMVLPGYVGLGFVMPWFGQLADDGSGLIALTDTPDDLAFRLKTEPGVGVTAHPCWLPQLGALKYARVMTYRFFAATSVFELARCYRRHAEARMAVTPLKARLRERPCVEYLRGSMHIALWFMSDFRNFPEAERRLPYITYEEGFRRYRHLTQAAGVRKAIAHLDGWGRDGYDFNHPDILPPDERLGGWAGLRELTERLHGLGHAVMLHDNYVDYYMHTEAFKNADSTMDFGGERPENNEWLGGRQHWLCAQRAPFYTTRNFTELAERIKLEGAYLDCWTVGPLRECFDQRHLSTRTMTREAWTGVFEFCHRLGWLTSSESGNDWAVPGMDFAHTVQADLIPHPLQGRTTAFGISIPLYAMVWHDCVMVPGWIEMDAGAGAVIREGCVVPQTNDMRLWTMLWGGIPSFRTRHLEFHPIEGNMETALAAEAAFIKSLHPIADFSAHVGFEPMTEWRMSPDGREQTAVYAGGGCATVNFADNTYRLKAEGFLEEGRFER